MAADAAVRCGQVSLKYHTPVLLVNKWCLTNVKVKMKRTKDEKVLPVPLRKFKILNFS